VEFTGGLRIRHLSALGMAVLPLYMAHLAASHCLAWNELFRHS